VEASDAGLPSDPTKKLAEAINAEDLASVRWKERIGVVGVVSAPKVTIHLAGHGDVEVYDAGTLDLTGLSSNRDLAVLEVEVAHSKLPKLVGPQARGCAEDNDRVVAGTRATCAEAHLL